MRADINSRNNEIEHLKSTIRDKDVEIRSVYVTQLEAAKVEIEEREAVITNMRKEREMSIESSVYKFKELQQEITRQNSMFGGV